MTRQEIYWDSEYFLIIVFVVMFQIAKHSQNID